MATSLLSLFSHTHLKNTLQKTIAGLTLALQMLLLSQTVPDIILFTPTFCKVIEIGNAKKKFSRGPRQTGKIVRRYDMYSSTVILQKTLYSMGS